MLKVFKYPVHIDDYFSIDLPEGARVLHAEAQDGRPQLWALVDPETNVTVTRRFRFAGTGHPITEPLDKLRHVSTFSMEGGRLIFHIFEVL
jgi:hypothetical protein